MMKNGPLLLLASVLVLSGCAAATPTSGGDDVVDSPSQPAEQVPAAPASELNPSLNCDVIAGLISPMTDGMYPTDFSYTKEDEIGCAWVSTPGATAFQGSPLDLMVFIWQDESYGPADALAAQCETTRIVASGLDTFGGCIYEDVAGDFTFDALMPYFKIRIAYSCEGSTTCTPTLPADSQQLVVNAMGSIGAALAAG